MRSEAHKDEPLYAIPRLDGISPGGEPGFSSFRAESADAVMESWTDCLRLDRLHTATGVEIGLGPYLEGRL